MRRQLKDVADGGWGDPETVGRDALNPFLYHLLFGNQVSLGQKVNEDEVRGCR